jgi:hypothetical protein
MLGISYEAYQRERDRLIDWAIPAKAYFRVNLGRVT